MSKPVEVILIDDHDGVRYGLRVAFSLYDEFRFMAMPNDVDYVTTLCRQPTRKIFLVDILMPDIDGLQMISEIIKCDPQAYILVLSAHMEEDVVLDALQKGARGYMLKNASIDHIVQAIHCVLAGRYVVDSMVMQYAARINQLNLPLEVMQ